ncbi:MAG: hypothetical protein JSW53_02160 [Candidatus Bathyarchaeota archaeon]|nr:MAG: hypothetical protein JSW53_02160 [Candidatus Bathyarchaeota archaeon]
MWDQITLSWNNILKFSLEVASILFAVAPITVFLWAGSPTDNMLATIFSLSVSLVSLVIMRIVEEEMYEVLRGIRNGKIWYNLR